MFVLNRAHILARSVGLCVAITISRSDCSDQDLRVALLADARSLS